MTDITLITGRVPRTSEALKQLAAEATGTYLLINTKNVDYDLGYLALERFAEVAADTGADLVFADHYDRLADGTVRRHPLIDCQAGALRDDFDFGALWLVRTAALKALDLPDGLRFGALYDLRLRLDKIFHIKEFLYTEFEPDLRASGQKQFDYVDTRNREVQIEMERICTDYLRRTGALLEGSAPSAMPYAAPSASRRISRSTSSWSTTTPQTVRRRCWMPSTTRVWCTSCRNGPTSESAAAGIRPSGIRIAVLSPCSWTATTSTADRIPCRKSSIPSARKVRRWSSALT